MRNSLFAPDGVHAIVDGQFGSTGKGVLSAWLAEQDGAERVYCAITNGGPNSGHTFYHDGEKHVLKQLPTFSVKRYLMGDKDCHAVLSAGAIVNPTILIKEAYKYPGLHIYVHPNAAWLTEADIEAEHSGSVAAVAGTRSGTGAAIARKVLRDPEAVAGAQDIGGMPPNVFFMGDTWAQTAQMDPVIMEVSQGFSLGVNSKFYPKVTSRECTVMQGLADARIPPRHVTRTYMSIRTFPIRVGNVDGYSSGDWYDDQRETTWEALGQTPELTTVTQRIRRVATFSAKQFAEARVANDPDFVFVNFLNYLPSSQQSDFLARLKHIGNWVRPFDLIGGWGPESKDVRRVMV